MTLKFARQIYNIFNFLRSIRLSPAFIYLILDAKGDEHTEAEVFTVN